MKILVNTRLLLPNKLEGIGWFTYETLKRITLQHPEHKFIFAFDRKYDPAFVFSANVTPCIIPPQARHPLLFYLWFEHAVPSLVKKFRPDLFLSQDSYNSLASPVRSLIVIHDLYFEHNVADFPYLVGKYLRYFSPRFAAKATRIATVSEFSKQDITHCYGIDPAKIDVVFDGANENFTPLTIERKQATMRKYTGGKPYFIYVGSLHPRKNIANLLRAYDAFRNTVPSDIRLVLVGEKMWGTRELREIYERMQFRSEVIFTGRMDSGRLHDLLGSALALTYVSQFEGFGIPILEAFYCETPVITSGLSSMPEIAGDAALLVQPDSVDSIRDAMCRMAGDQALRNELVTRGRLRREMFSWQKTAGLLWNSIEKCME